MYLYRVRSPHLGDVYARLRDERLVAVESPFDSSAQRAENLVEGEELGGLDDVELLAPTTPSKIVCVGRNFEPHADELDNPVPDEPLIFLKPPSAIVGPGASIRLPETSDEVHHEAELAVVIGEQIAGASPDEADEAILGYTCGNDVTARDLQNRDKTFTRAKGFDTFCPLGPRMVTADAFEPTDHGIRARVDGALRQSASLDRLIFSIPEVVSFISRIMTLEPEDVVLTGTPSGVGSLASGETVEIEIDGLGTLINEVA